MGRIRRGGYTFLWWIGDHPPRHIDVFDKAPFGAGSFSKIKNVRYLSWEDAFDVEFEDGLCILEPHATIRRANKISPKAKFARLEIEDWTQSGFYVHYDNGQTAEVSWAFIRELPPKK